MIEKTLGMSIEVKELGDKEADKETKTSSAEQQTEVPYSITIKKNNIMFDLGIKMQHNDANIYLNDGLLITVKAGKTGVIKVKKNNNIGRAILVAINKGEKIKVVV